MKIYSTPKVRSQINPYKKKNTETQTHAPKIIEHMSYQWDTNPLAPKKYIV